MMRIAVMWNDIGHYHAERMIALQNVMGIDLRVIESKGVPGFGNFRAAFERIQKINLLNLGLDPNTKLEVIRNKVYEALDTIKPDAVFVAGWSTRVSIVALDWCSRKRIPSIIMSDSTEIDKVRYRWKELIKRRILKMSSAMFVAGSLHAAYAEKLGMRKSQISVGYDVVDNQHFHDGANKARIHDNLNRQKYSLPPRYLLCCARFVEKKNHIQMLRAFELYKKKNLSDDIHLVLVGGGILDSEIRSFVHSNNLDASVHIKGFQSYDDMPVLYGLAEALILPSVEEQWGLVVNEAMACGLPILLSSHCGCAVDLVRDGHNGFIFDPYDVESIARSLSKFCSRATDKILMSNISLNIISAWDLMRFKDGFETALENAIAVPIPSRSLLNALLTKLLVLRA